MLSLEQSWSYSGPRLSRYVFIICIKWFTISRSVLGKFRKLGKAVHTSVIKVSLVSANDEHFMRKCISSLTSPAVQCKQNLSSIGIF